MRLSSKKALVIGGSSGIGFAIAESLLKEGAEVIIVGRKRATLEKSAEQLDGKVRFIEADISEEPHVCKLFSSIESLDILVMSASVPAAGKISDLSNEFIEKVFQIKFFGALWAIKYAVPKMMRGGNIVMMSGIWGHRPPIGFAVGASVNGAVEGLTRALAIELADKGIRVNCICPGITKTHPFIDEENDQYKKFLSEIPLNRFGQPNEIADAALFLATNMYVTGIVLNVDGGWLIS